MEERERFEGRRREGGERVERGRSEGREREGVREE